MIVHDESICEGLTLRQNTFEHCAREAGVPVQNLRLPAGSDHLLIGSALVDQMKSSRVDALFAPTLMASMGALHACRRLGLTPGEDLVIIGCDCDRWSRGCDPQLTYVDVSWSEAGRVASQKLLDLREAHEYRFENILLPPRIVFGDTCPVPVGFCGVDTAAGISPDTKGDDADASSSP
jgi:DNA-binding LacI/PurR family transcriptional regulator